MPVKNPIRIKILSVVAILVIIGLQKIVYDRNKEAIVLRNKMVTTTGTIIKYQKFGSIDIGFVDMDSQQEVLTSKQIDRSYDPFVGLKVQDKVPISYNKEDYSYFFVDGYESKPSSFVFYFSLIIGLAAQLLSLGVLTDFLDKDFQRLR